MLFARFALLWRSEKTLNCNAIYKRIYIKTAVLCFLLLLVFPTHVCCIIIRMRETLSQCFLGELTWVRIDYAMPTFFFKWMNKKKYIYILQVSFTSVQGTRQVQVKRECNRMLVVSNVQYPFAFVLDSVYTPQSLQLKQLSSSPRGNYKVQ